MTVVISVISQSCSNSDASMGFDTGTANAQMISTNLNMEYLDLDVSNMNKLTQDQKFILKKAKDRIDPFIKYQNKEYSLTINNAKKVQMSERLFELIKSTIANTNEEIKDLNVVSDTKDPRVLHIITPSNLQKNKRFKILGYEPNPVDGQNSWNVDWSGFHLYLNNETTKTLTNALIMGAAATEIAAIIMAATGVAAPAGVVTQITAVVMGSGAGILSNMNEGNGVVITPGWFGYGIESR